MTGIREEWATTERFPNLPGALCRTCPPEWFFPAPGDTATATMAAGICTTCPERTACLSFALASRIRFGIWGGELLGYTG